MPQWYLFSQLFLLYNVVLVLSSLDINVWYIEEIASWYMYFLLFICRVNYYYYYSFFLIINYIFMYEIFFTEGLWLFFQNNDFCILSSFGNLYELYSLDICLWGTFWSYLILNLYSLWSLYRFSEFFRWAFYWHTCHSIIELQEFYKSLNTNASVLWLLNWNFLDFNYRFFMISFVLREWFYRYVFNSLFYCSVLKVCNKLSLFQKFIYKNYIFRRRRKFYLKKIKTKKLLIKNALKWALHINYRKLGVFGFTINKQLSYLFSYIISNKKFFYSAFFFLINICFTSIYTYMNIFFFFKNLVFFYMFYIFMRRMLRRKRNFFFLRRRKFLFLLNLFLLLFLKQGWFFLKFVRKAFWKQKKDNIKKIIFFLKIFFKKFNLFFLKLFQVIGILFFFKGKIGTYGNSRKKILRISFGALNSTTFFVNNIVSHCSFINKSGKTKCRLSLFF